MGNLTETLFNVEYNDIINNQNYHDTSKGEIGNSNPSIEKKGIEKYPANILDLNKTESSIRSISKIPISSKNVIIQKKGDPKEDYEVIRELGAGAYGQVYKVKNKYNNSIRAMKKIDKKWLGNLNDNEVMKEVEILKNLNHPYIIKLYEYYVTDKYLFLIYEFCDEGDLQRKIQKLKKFPEFIVKIIMLQIFKALIYLEEKCIIHGDLKLENILVKCYDNDKRTHKDGFIEAIKHDMQIVDSINSRDEIDKNEDNNEKKEKENTYDLSKYSIFNYGIKLIDFGCSKMFTRTKKNFSDIIGTLVYCSPEVLANDYNKSCDMWSCGVLMYALLSGYFPFDGENEEEITGKILYGKLEFDNKYFHGVSEDAKDLISKCLKKIPSKRITIQDALNHKFFKDLKQSKNFTEEEKKQLLKLKKLNKQSKFYQLVLTYLSYNFSDNKILNNLLNLFNKLDRNGDNKITKYELFKAYKEAGIPLTSKELDNIVNAIDFDNNGSIDYEEFIRICIPKEKLFTEENLENLFLLFDKDKNGLITSYEIMDFIQSSKKVKEEVKQKILNEISDVADEIIDCEQFKKIMITMANSGN